MKVLYWSLGSKFHVAPPPPCGVDGGGVVWGGAIEPPGACGCVSKNTNSFSAVFKKKPTECCFQGSPILRITLIPF